MNNYKSVIAVLNGESKKIFDVILKNGPITKSELLKLTNMKLTTLNRFINPIKSMGLIEESGIGESTGGRKPVLYDVKRDRYYIIGVDISRTYAQVVVVNMKIEILFKERFAMDKAYTPAYTMNVISSIIAKALSMLKITFDRVLGIGLGVVGPIDQEKGVIRNPVNFSSNGWTDVPIKDMFIEQYSLPVFFDNGANTAVLAEYIFGDGKDLKNITYVNCGVGIRTAAITSGIIVRTINDTEDAFGHMVIDVDGKLCSCGNYGCIECYSSLASIVENYKSAVKRGIYPHVSKPLEDIHYVDILQAGEEGDVVAQEIIERAAVILGKGLVNYINLLSPQMVILSGPLIVNSELFYNTCIEVASNRNYLKGNKSIHFNKGGKFNEDAISVGAAVLVVESLISI